MYFPCLAIIFRSAYLIFKIYRMGVKVYGVLVAMSNENAVEFAICFVRKLSKGLLKRGVLLTIVRLCQKTIRIF